MMTATEKKRLNKKVYERELLRLQGQLVDMQEWVRTSGTRLVVVFEGRDAAGKGGAIQRISEYLNPRICRIVALPAPTERQRTQWYFQRYVEHLPAAGEIVLLDRSWYNRGGVERVMGFATPAEYSRFLRQCPLFEEMLIEDGILLRKYWFSVSDHEQEKRFRDRMNNPMKRWKLSPMDLQSITRWEDYSRAKDEMFAHTDTAMSPWMMVESEDKRRARINMIAHLLASVPWRPVHKEVLDLPERPPSRGYQRPPRERFHEVPDHAATLDLTAPSCRARPPHRRRRAPRPARGAAPARAVPAHRRRRDHRRRPGRAAFQRPRHRLPVRARPDGEPGARRRREGALRRPDAAAPPRHAAHAVGRRAGDDPIRPRGGHRRPAPRPVPDARDRPVRSRCPRSRRVDRGRSRDRARHPGRRSDDRPGPGEDACRSWRFR